MSWNSRGHKFIAHFFTGIMSRYLSWQIQSIQFIAGPAEWIVRGRNWIDLPKCQRERPRCCGFHCWELTELWWTNYSARKLFEWCLQVICTSKQASRREWFYVTFTFAELFVMLAVLSSLTRSKSDLAELAHIIGRSKHRTSSPISWQLRSQWEMVIQWAVWWQLRKSLTALQPPGSPISTQCVSHLHQFE